MLTGRFNPERESEEYPTAEITETSHQIRLARADKQNERATQLAALEREQRADVVGTPREWKLYRQAFDAAVDDAVHSGTIPDRESLTRVFKHLEEAGTLFADERGALWMEVPDSNGSSRLGLSVSNVLAADSDSRLADELLLARVGRVLKSPRHGRETMLEFQEDWALLQEARTTNSVSAARGGAAASEPTATIAGGGNE